MTSNRLYKLKNEALRKIMTCLPHKRIKLDVESGAESMAGIFQDDRSSVTQDPSDDIDSVVRDVIDFTDQTTAIASQMNQGMIVINAIG